MSDVRSSLKNKPRKDSPLSIKKETKERLKNLDFVKKNTWGEIIEILVDFYEENKKEFKKWRKKKK